MHQISKSYKNIFITHTHKNIDNSIDLKVSYAFDKYLLNKELKYPSLFIRRVKPTLVISADINPWAICDMDKIEKDNITLTRRYTKGNTLYLDQGAILASFVAPQWNFYKKEMTHTLNIIDAISDSYCCKSSILWPKGIAESTHKSFRKIGFYDILHDKNLYSLQTFYLFESCSYHNLCYYLKEDLVTKGNDVENLCMISKNYHPQENKVIDLRNMNNLSQQMLRNSIIDFEEEDFYYKLIDCFAEKEPINVIKVNQNDLLNIQEVAKEYKKISAYDYAYIGNIK